MKLKVEQLQETIEKLKDENLALRSVEEINNEEIKRLQNQKIEEKDLLSREKELNLL